MRKALWYKWNAIRFWWQSPRILPLWLRMDWWYAGPLIDMSGANAIKRRLFCREHHTCVRVPSKRYNYSECGNEKTYNMSFRCEKCGAFLGLQWTLWDAKQYKWVETTWAANEDCECIRKIPNCKHPIGCEYFNDDCTMSWCTYCQMPDPYGRFSEEAIEARGQRAVQCSEQ